ncbi:M15 family metallopeptidase [Microcoleus sp. FACHB-1515]|uniref:M15 family metallopeptidase n=1 Tax=Cyanophyceae TaxID=3028117 RepID=UPI001686334E|nr:M15 family metallopeptidase [Microcoleus sp. FACHB-1515]MBD2090447.1 M15 family metallopeptidase [Microcoleus sp. FACHB-1515]
MKPYHQVPIIECEEPLVAIPHHVFAIEHPHPYEKLGAPYGSKSPYFLRQGVLERLLLAQAALTEQLPGWKIQIFDAYRPIAVQQFMVDYTLNETARASGHSLQSLTPAQQQALLEQVYRFWAVPSRNPLTPPPHSTGAAIDVTLVDAAGQVVDMGSPIDEISARSYPNYFADCHDRESLQFHAHRQLLRQIMVSSRFCQHPNEWWHFSLGDQMWAWFENCDRGDTLLVAQYGAV